MRATISAGCANARGAVPICTTDTASITSSVSIARSRSSAWAYRASRCSAGIVPWGTKLLPDAAVLLAVRDDDPQMII
jgi:hypothetical protein